MAAKLRKLLKRNRALEQELFYDTRDDDWRELLITPQELHQALLQLSNRIHENRNDELSVLRMLNDIEHTATRPLAAFEKNALQVVELLFNYLRAQSKFDPHFIRLLNSLQLAFTKLALNDLSFLDNLKHPAVQFLDSVIKLGHHFDGGSGQVADYFVKAIDLLVNRLADKANIKADYFQIALNRLNEYFDDFNKRVETNEGKILAQIELESRTAQADFYTQHLIKQKTEGDEIPVLLLEFFQDHLFKVLYQTILKHGVKSKACQQVLTDMDTLSWSITASHTDATYTERFEADVPPMMKRLFDAFEQYQLMDDYIKDFFIQIEAIHRQKLDGMRVDLDVMIAADIFSDESYDSNELQSWALNETSKDFPLDELQVGQWYQLKELDHSGSRLLKLLANNELLRRVYFVNLSGELSLSLDYAELAQYKDKLKLYAMHEQIQFTHALAALERELEGKAKQLLRLKNERIRAAELEAQRQREEKEARKRELQQQIEREKRKQEALRLAEQRKKEQALAAQKAKEEEEARRRFAAKGTIRKMKPGALVAYQDDTGHWHELSLMLISKTTSRYIFVNARGEKIIEPNKTELAYLITDERLKLVDQDGKDNDPLSSLVAARRSKLSNR